MRLHTRLLTRAREWETRQRQSSFLLSRVEIREYNDWFRDSHTKNPKPTQLQLTYFVTSQTHQSRQLYIFSAAAIGTLAITLALLTFAIFLNRQLEDRDERATDVAGTNIAIEVTNDAIGTSFADQEIEFTSQAITSVARQTENAQTRVAQRTEDALSFATLTQQAASDGTREAVESTLEFLVIEYQVWSLDRATLEQQILDVTETALWIPTASLTPTPTASVTPSPTIGYEATVAAIETQNAEVVSVLTALADDSDSTSSGDNIK